MVLKIVTIKLNNGSWERVEYETAGSYLVIPVRGSSVRIA